VQWLQDPGRDGALNLVADQPGRRDQQLREICERLIERAPERRIVPVVAAQVVVDIPPMAAVQAGPERGELSGVPGLPPGYLVRDELAAVIEAVVAVEAGAVGLTGEVPAVGLHGQGEIGKSVLAAAVARDEDIRRWFPDGAYWVTVGGSLSCPPSWRTRCSASPCFLRYPDPGPRHARYWARTRSRTTRTERV
jgi:hypothetical protein